MKKIGIISDTHGYLHPRVKEHFSNCDEIWHAGDIGTIELLEELESFKPLRAVYGNIDGTKIRAASTEWLNFEVEHCRILMTHIAGYPGRYNPVSINMIQEKKPHLFVCGHSHILKVMKDPKLGHLHINPGAAGKVGFQQVKTLLRLVIDGADIRDLEVIELAK